MTEPFTEQQLRDFARKVVESNVEDPDFMGVGEQFSDEWADLSPDEFDKAQNEVHNLACSATVTVSWPSEDIAAEMKQLRAEVWRLRENAAKLRALESAGVDNWDGYSYAMSLLNGEDDCG